MGRVHVVGVTGIDSGHGDAGPEGGLVGIDEAHPDEGDGPVGALSVRLR